MKNDNFLIKTSIITVAFVLVCSVLILWIIKHFDFSGTYANTKIIASTLAMVGVVFSASVTLVGILLRHSIDQRSVDLKVQEQDRLKLETIINNAQRKEAENRLKLEAAIHAIQLLGSNSETDVSVAQRAGVLVTLTNLGLTDLAITMLTHMVPSDMIDPTTASLVIDYAFRSDDEMLQINASLILNYHAKEFLIDDGRCEFPRYVSLDWKTNLHRLARRSTALALLKITIGHPFNKWDQEYLTALLATLFSLIDEEKDREIWNGVGFCLKELVQPCLGFRKIIIDENKILDLYYYKERVAKSNSKETSSGFRKLKIEIEKWVKDAKIIDETIP